MNLKNSTKFLNFEFKTNVISNLLEKYVSFRFHKNLVFIDGSQFLDSSPNNVRKNLGRNDFQDFSQVLIVIVNS